VFDDDLIGSPLKGLLDGFASLLSLINVGLITFLNEY